MGTWCAQLLLLFYDDSFETLQVWRRAGVCCCYLINLEANSFFIFDRGCPYKVQWLLKVGTLKWRLQRTNMTLESNVKDTKNQSYGSQQELILYSLTKVVLMQMTYIYYQFVWLLMHTQGAEVTGQLRVNGK